MNETCILCKSKGLKTLQTAKSSDINDLYVKDLNIDILDEFKGNEQIKYVKCTNCNLCFFTPICNGSSSFYESLQNSLDFYYKNNRYEFFFANDLIKNTDKVLEIGSGDASFAELISVKEYVGLEYNDEAVKTAKKKNINLINQSIEDFSKENKNYFDIVCSFQVLEHVPDPKVFIEASLKTIKKGGLLIFGIPSAESILTNNINHTLNLPPHHITRWFDECLYKLNEIFDVEIVEIKHEPLNKNHVKNYLANSITNKIHRFFSNKNKVIKNSKVVFFFDRLVKKIITKLKLTTYINKKNKIGEAVIIVLKKN
jgi:SAM-dependent methyltransferase